MKIGIATDHHGIHEKKQIIEKLKEQGYQVVDCGPNTEEMVDYPVYAFKIGEMISHKQIDYGILLCGSGIGMSIACNKVKGVRCAKVSTVEEAMYSRLHNNANVIAMSSSYADLEQAIYVFLTTDFSNEERHQRRVQEIDNYEC